MDEQELLRRLREAFKIESAERLASLSTRLMELEKTDNAELCQEIIEVIYREAHSLKGAARAVNLTEIEAISQSMEGVFGAMKRGEITPSSTVFDTMHEVVSFIENILATEQKSAGKDELSAILQQLENLQAGQTPATQKKPPRAAGPPAGNDAAQQIKDTMSSALLKEQPGRQESAGVDAGEQPAASTNESPDKSSQKLKPAVENPHLGSSVRISTDRLDKLLLKAEEMIAVKLSASQEVNELKKLRHSFESWHKKWMRKDALLRRYRKELAIENEQGGTRSAEIQKFLDWNRDFINTMHKDIRILAKSAELNQRFLDRKITYFLEDMKRVIMLPSTTLFAPFPRMVRELGRSQGKEIDLELKGAEVEIDRRILEELKDPLVHLLRNCVDHGVEKPEERRRLNKPERGRIFLHIDQIEGGKVEITLGDDGHGIDPDMVRNSAVKRGLISAEDAARLTEKEAQGLIFHSGMSTASSLSQLSGRGLGMAIFLERVEKLGGQLDFASIPGKGSSFTVCLPLSLATFRGTLVQVAGQPFLAPSSHLVAVLHVNVASIRTVQNKATINYDGEPLSLVGLADTLQLEKPVIRKESNKIQVMVLGTSNRRIGFEVDEVLAEQEVLFKELGKQLLRVKNIAGATILGTGQVVPILNVHDLLKSAVGTVGERFISARTKQEEQKPKSILVVEDSITSRTLLKSILEAAGYVVTTAVDGVDGYTKLKINPIDLVLSDVEMPRMSGFELTEKIRADETLANIPLILCTSLATDQDRERGIQVGANAYIVKSNFDQSNLLQVIEKLI
ncbi:MAG: hybrid sensor histidine kinase/response regulator [Proteobacteria bacterium]|nr:hybrid sensor histidine kinase/response regulator [Pseudomonadota bacterium]MBU4295675.1 hybrid sensor histidine kinase/response regulator [Pseudomonadota bacterium]MCG2746866.1 hybrid sensor histidine kinase/response regulator [Desulfobulbaceae bacterium]